MYCMIVAWKCGIPSWGIVYITIACSFLPFKFSCQYFWLDYFTIFGLTLCSKKSNTLYYLVFFWFEIVDNYRFYCLFFKRTFLIWQLLTKRIFREYKNTYKKCLIKVRLENHWKTIICENIYQWEHEKISHIAQLDMKKMRTRQSRRYAENLRDTAVFRG